MVIRIARRYTRLQFCRQTPEAPSFVDGAFALNTGQFRADRDMPSRLPCSFPPPLSTMELDRQRPCSFKGNRR